MGANSRAQRTTGVSPDAEILAATWGALVDPRSVAPDPPARPREIAALVDGAWSDDLAAWRLARQLVTYGHRQKSLAERQARLNGASVDAGIVWAYWAVLELYEALRTRLAA